MNDEIRKKIVHINADMSKKTQTITMSVDEWFMEYSERLAKEVLEHCIKIVTEEELKIFKTIAHPEVGTFTPYIAMELKKQLGEL